MRYGIVEFGCRDITDDICNSLIESGFWKARFRFESGSGAYRSHQGSEEFVGYKFYVAYTEGGRSISLTKYEGISEGWNLWCWFGRDDQGYGSMEFAKDVIQWLLNHGIKISTYVDIDNDNRKYDALLSNILSYLEGEEEPDCPYHGQMPDDKVREFQEDGGTHLCEWCRAEARYHIEHNTPYNI